MVNFPFSDTVENSLSLIFLGDPVQHLHKTNSFFGVSGVMWCTYYAGYGLDGYIN